MLEINNQTQEKINIKKTKEIVNEFLKIYKKSNYLVSLALVGSRRIKTLNRKYRGQDVVTDVLSFSGEENNFLFFNKNIAADQDLLSSLNKKNSKSATLDGEKKINIKDVSISAASQKLSLAADHLELTYLGEIVINISEAKKISKYQKTLEEIGLGKEKKAHHRNYIFYFLLVHGLLHLSGYDDLKAKERLEMLKLGRDFLKKVL